MNFIESGANAVSSSNMRSLVPLKKAVSPGDTTLANKFLRMFNVAYHVIRSTRAFSSCQTELITPVRHCSVDTELIC